MGQGTRLKLSEARVFFGKPVQVRAIYDVSYEKGRGRNGSLLIFVAKMLRLVDYTNAEGSERP